MKKIVMYVLLLGAALLVPIRGEDVGKLIPIELIRIYKTEETLIIDTDLGATGMGSTVEEAIENLKATTPGIIFLDTADYLLADETAKDELPEMGKYLKASVRVCESEGEIDLKKASEYLSVHKPSARLKDNQNLKSMEILTAEDGRLFLKEK